MVEEPKVRGDAQGSQTGRVQNPESHGKASDVADLRDPGRPWDASDEGGIRAQEAERTLGGPGLLTALVFGAVLLGCCQLLLDLLLQEFLLLT